MSFIQEPTAPSIDVMGAQSCSIEGCEMPIKGHGWCNAHYLRWRRHGDPLGGQKKYRPRKSTPCSVEGCDDRVKGSGLCGRHYEKWRRHGDPLVGVRIYGRPEETVSMRTEWQGACLVWTGSRNIKGYGSFKLDGKYKAAHRYAWEREHGPIPDGAWIDHVCHNRACVNVDHLRLATPQENGRHLSGPNRNNRSTGIRNVYRYKNGYGVSLGVDGKSQYFGLYPTIQAATAVAEQKRRELFGEFAGKG